MYAFLFDSWRNPSRAAWGAGAPNWGARTSLSGPRDLVSGDLTSDGGHDDKPN